MILAGGTDVFPSLGDRPLSGPVLDISGLAEIRGIQFTAEHIVFGARTTWSEVLAASLPRGFDGLKAAAREVGSVQIQNAATIAGNLCNASPAADGVAALLALDAELVLASRSASRTLPLGESSFSAIARPRVGPTRFSLPFAFRGGLKMRCPHF